MTLRATFGGGRVALGGAGSSLDVFDVLAIGGNLSPGNNTGWSSGGMMRYGGDIATIAGLNAFDNGSGGATPNRGYQPFVGMMWRRARNTAAGNTPIDWYCGVRPNFPFDAVPVDLPSPTKVWEVGVTMTLDATPAVAITRDCGLVFVLSNNTAYGNCLRAGVAVSNDFAGFGVVFNGTNGELLWIVKKSGAAGGAPLTESVSLGVYGALRPIPVRVRFHAATVGQAAYLEVFVDNVRVLRRDWGPGTILPVVADATFQAVLGYFSVMMRAAQESTANAALLFRDFRVRAAYSAALLD